MYRLQKQITTTELSQIHAKFSTAPRGSKLGFPVGQCVRSRGQKWKQMHCEPRRERTHANDPDEQSAASLLCRLPLDIRLGDLGPQIPNEVDGRARSKVAVLAPNLNPWNIATVQEG